MNRLLKKLQGNNKMKKFKEYLAETGAVGVQNQASVDIDGYDTFDISNPSVLKRVNAFVGSIGDREYLIPESAVHQLRNFLMRIGIQFPKVELPENGNVTVPLSQWGGRFGKDLDTNYDEFVNDDGITNRIAGGLSLKIESETVQNGSCKVYAKIV